MIAETYGKRLLANCAIGWDVAQVVDDQQRARKGANCAAHHDGECSDLLRNAIGGADGGDESEEHEHEQFAEAEIAIRLGSAGVEPCGQQRGGAHGDEPPRRSCGEHKPGHRSYTKRAERRLFHGLRRSES